MKYFILVLLLLFSTVSVNADESFLDPQYSFIDSAFEGIKPVTDKEFNDTINKLTPQPVENTFGAKLKAFLFGRKYGVDPAPKIQDKDFENNDDTTAIQNLTKGIYYIRLTVSIVGEDSIIPLGNYKIKQQIINNEPMLFFYQGSKEYGKLKLKKYNDELKGKNDIAYSRVDVISPYLIRIVYATIDDTQCAMGRVYLQN